MAAEYKRTPVNVPQSPPLDLSKPYNPDWLKSRVILVTGGASGFGAAFVRKWAGHGAVVIVGDINVEKGDQVVRQIRQETGNSKVHFVHCDVTDWQSQVNFFQEAVRLSPHGGIDAVIANAGVGDVEPLHEPHDFSVPEPKKPNFKVLDVNLYGVLYTTQLAIYWLQKNPGSKPCSPKTDPSKTPRDRHILLVGSIASLAPIVGGAVYGTAKHGVLGLFRSLRLSSHLDGIRVTAIFPYFTDTAILQPPIRFILAGAAMSEVEDVVDAATRLTADSSILGRGLMIGPKAKVKQDGSGEWVVVPKESAEGEVRAVWEAYADDTEDSELFTKRIVRLVNGVAALKGWIAWFSDIVAAVRYSLFG